MSSSSAPPLLSAAAGTGKPQSRSASKAVVKASSGFHVFRIEGYSLTSKTIPGGEKISSKTFTIGGRQWRIDLYPNGTDTSKDESDAMALYLVYTFGHGDRLTRVGAEYKFSLLDHTGAAAYELVGPAEKGVFSCSGDDDDGPGCGHDAFIGKDELEKRRTQLLFNDDCLAVRCDVGVIDLLSVESVKIGGAKGKKRSSSRSARRDYYSDDDTESSSSSSSSDSDSRRRQRRRNKRRQRLQSIDLDDSEYILRTYES